MSSTESMLSCGRSNQFKVRDLSAFKRALGNFDVSVVEAEEGNNQVSILAHPRPGISFSSDQHHIMEIVVKHLDDTSVVVLMQIGYHSDTFELIGNAIAVNAKGEIRQVDLDYIYRLAQDLNGGDPVARCAD